MSRSKKWRLEWAFFLGENGRRQYNHICKKCVHGCKQSFRACLVACPHYSSKRSKICEDRKGWMAAVVGVVEMCVNCQNCEAVGKLFADLWKRLVFFHQVVNGFSISTSGSFPYFHDARKSSGD